jgi:hypothetical protein
MWAHEDAALKAVEIGALVQHRLRMTEGRIGVVERDTVDE